MKRRNPTIDPPTASVIRQEVGTIRQQCKYRHPRKTQQDHTGRKPVEAIGKIDGIGDGDQRENRQRVGEPGTDGVETEERHNLDCDITVENDNTRGNDLASKFEPVVQVTAIIPDAKDENDANTCQQRDNSGIEFNPEKYRDQYAQHHADATNPGDGCGVHLAFARHVHQLQPIGITGSVAG